MIVMTSLEDTLAYTDAFSNTIFKGRLCSNMFSTFSQVTAFRLEHFAATTMPAAVMPTADMPKPNELPSKNLATSKE